MKLAVVTIIFILLSCMLSITSVYGPTTATNDSLNAEVFLTFDTNALRIENVTTEWNIRYS